MRACQIQVGLGSHAGRVQLLGDAQLLVRVLDGITVVCGQASSMRHKSSVRLARIDYVWENNRRQILYHLPVLAPVHVALVQVAEQLEAIDALLR